VTRLRWEIAPLMLLAGCFVIASPACGTRKFAEHVTTTTGMTPLIPRNSTFYSKPPTPGQVPARGDVVVFKSATRKGDEVLLVKRVVAVEGDEVEIVAKELRLNGVAIAEPYVSHSDLRTMPSGPDVDPQMRLRDNLPRLRVGPGEVFVLGDNRDESVDSRFYGSIKAESIVGYFVSVK
jgi:signal peptidase I